MNQKKIGNFISELRKEKNLTQEQLGQKLGVSNKTISRWENGNYLPDISLFQSISQEFGITINELLKGERIEKQNELKESHNNIISILSKNKKDKKKIKIFISIISLLLIFTLIVIIYQANKLEGMKEDTETHLVFKKGTYKNSKGMELDLKEYGILKFLDITDDQIKNMTKEDKELLVSSYYGTIEAINWYGTIGEYIGSDENNLFDEKIKLITLIKTRLPFITTIAEDNINKSYCLLGHSKYGTLIVSEYKNNKCLITNTECDRLKQDGSTPKIELDKYCS